MSDWTKVVTDPLGLAGFALFLVFGYLAKVKKSDNKPWLAPVAVLAGIAALAGGLTLGYLRIPKGVVSPTPVSTAPLHEINQVQQTSTGAGSPNVQGANGDVTITIDQSTGQAEPAKPAAAKPEQKK